MTKPKTTKFADGYQAALNDIALAFAEGGQPRVREWLLANLSDAQMREIVIQLVPAQEAR